MKEDQHLVLIDGSGYIFRAYYALPSLSRKSDGLPIGAVSGFCNMLWKFVCGVQTKTWKTPVTHLAIIFDHFSPSFRHTIYPPYKGNRIAQPEDLIPQFGLIRLATKAFGLPCIEMEGFEADDIIATYAARAQEKKYQVTIVSSDKDFMQLIRPGISVYDPVKEKEIYTEEVIEKWGVPPEKMADLQALVGDSCDNIPGIPGIGPKTAAQLLKTFHDLENLLASIEQIPQQKRRDAIFAHKDNVRIFRQLVELKQDILVSEDVDDFRLFPPDGVSLIAFLKAMEFSSLIRRVAEKTGTDPHEVNKAYIEMKEVPSKQDVLPIKDMVPTQEDLFNERPLEIGEGSYFDEREGSCDDHKDWTVEECGVLCSQKIKNFSFESYRIHNCLEDVESLKMLVAQAYNKGAISVYIVTSSSSCMVAKIRAIGLCAFQSNDLFFLPYEEEEPISSTIKMHREQALQVIKDLLEDPAILKIGFDIKTQMLIALRHQLMIQSYDDVMLMSYTLQAGATQHQTLNDLTQQWLEIPLRFQKEERNDVECPLEHQIAELLYSISSLWEILRYRLILEGLISVYERLEKPLAGILARMEIEGVSIDEECLHRLSKELEKELLSLEENIHALAGESFSISSPKQIGDILFSRMNLAGGEKTKTGQWATSANILKDLADEGNIFAEKILRWRQLSKLKSTYTDSLPTFVHTTSKRIHTTYSLVTTRTGRLSSSAPNLQNIPVRTLEGLQIKEAFVASKGYKFLLADYSQIELRILAHIADIPELCRAFAEGVDIHSLIASEIFYVPIAEMTPDVRHRAKAINFGIIYGISAFSLAKQLSISREEAREYIKKYFKRFPGIQEYMEETCRSAKIKGYVTTAFGRRIHYPEINAKNAAIRSFNERAAINARIQGTASDIMRRAMIGIDRKMQEVSFFRMLLQVHDELVFEVLEDNIQEAKILIKKKMEDAPMPALSLKVPLEVKISSGDNWRSAYEGEDR